MNAQFFARLSLLSLFSALPALAAAPAKARSERVGEPVNNIEGARRGVHYEEHGKLSRELLEGKAGKLDWRTDVMQGEMGDCFFLSTVDKMLQLDAHAIDSHLKTKADGSLDIDEKVRIQVYFWAKSPTTGAFHKEWVKIDGETLVNSDGTDTYAHAVDHKYLVPLMEKAYAKYRDGQGGAGDMNKGFNRIGNGGYANHVMRALIGKDVDPGIELKPTPESANAAFESIVRGTSEDRPMVATTATLGKEMKERLAQADRSGLTDGRSKDMQLEGEGLLEGHAYTLISAQRVKMSDDEIAKAKEAQLISDEDIEVHGTTKFVRFVTLRNPWGVTTPDGNGRNNHGIFHIPLRKFTLFYNSFYVGPTLRS